MNDEIKKILASLSAGEFKDKAAELLRAGSAEAVKSILDACNIDAGEELCGRIFSALREKTEISDEDLGGIAGGTDNGDPGHC